MGQLKSQDFHIKSMSVLDISGTDVKKTTDFYILSLVLMSLATLMHGALRQCPSDSMVSPPLVAGPNMHHTELDL